MRQSPWHRIELYVMIKLPLAARDAAVACRKTFGVNPHYGANRFHCTILPLDVWAGWDADRLARLIAALDDFAHDPFFMVLDRIVPAPRDRVLLKARGGLRGPRGFHQALRDHLLAAHAVDERKYDFQPHLSLAYRGPHAGSETGPLVAATPIDPIGWWVDGFELVRSPWGSSRHDVLGRWPLVARQDALPLGDMLFRPSLPQACLPGIAPADADQPGAA